MTTPETDVNGSGDVAPPAYETEAEKRLAHLKEALAQHGDYNTRIDELRIRIDHHQLMIEKWQTELDRAKEDRIVAANADLLRKETVQKGTCENRLAHILRLLAEISELEKECEHIFERRKGTADKEAYDLERLRGEQRERELVLQHEHEKRLALIELEKLKAEHEILVEQRLAANAARQAKASETEQLATILRSLNDNAAKD